MNAELIELVEIIRDGNPQLSHGFKLSPEEAVERLASFIARQNTHLDVIKDVKAALEKYGEKDSAGVHPLQYACGLEGIDSIEDALNGVIAKHAATSPFAHDDWRRRLQAGDEITWMTSSGEEVHTGTISEITFDADTAKILFTDGFRCEADFSEIS